MSRVFLLGGSIGMSAALVFLLFDGLVSAAALVVSVFAILVTVGLLIGLALERSMEPVAGRTLRSPRSMFSGHLTGELCTTCHRPTVYVGSMRICPACDQIAVAN